MQVLKKATLLVLATAVAVSLLMWCLESFGFRGPVFAFLLNWLAMSWVAVSGQAIHFSLPTRYYSIKPFERTGRLYEHLGVCLFRRLVRRSPFSVFSPTLHLPREITLSALQHLDREMRKAEAGHVITFTLVLVFMGFALAHMWIDAAAWMLAFSVILNVYPVMLQRYNRIRLQAVIQRRYI
jgi:hypothetical protein